MIVGIDFSSHFIDLVLLQDTLSPPVWQRYELEGSYAFDRTRAVRDALPPRTASLWDEVEAVGIEDPRGHNAGALYRIQGSILACLPSTVLVEPWIPSKWRKAIGLAGNATKGDISVWAMAERLRLGENDAGDAPAWTQDAHDALGIATATANALIRG